MLEAATVDAPPRGPDYGAQVWARLERRLHPPRRAGSGPRVAGRRRRDAHCRVLVPRRSLARTDDPADGRPRRGCDPRAIQQRVVLAALGDHLDRTERALTEIANADVSGDVDLGPEQAWARDLLEANRLYRQSARGSASPVVVDLLADMEPILLEIVNSPRHLPPDELRALQARIERRSLVFKLRVTGARGPRPPVARRPLMEYQHHDCRARPVDPDG